jgi:Ca-activated chloride channel family protein
MIHLSHPYMLLWLAAVPALVVAFAWGDRRRASAGPRFSSSAASQVNSARRRWKRICILAAGVTLILALSKPVGKGSTQPLDAKSGDVVFLLDVSRSMLSADVLPTRLARAKAVIAGLTQQMQDQRLALVAFAGVPSVQCPLTIDEAFFQVMLEHTSPESVARGGTRIGDAIQFSLVSVFDDVARGRKQLVIVTDGGDQDSDPIIAAQSAKTHGVELLVIGVGDETTGALVPVSDSDRTPVLYRGAPVRTRLEPGVLQSVALAGAGKYFPAGTRDSGVAAIYQQLMAGAGSAPRRDGESPVSSWLVILAALLLTVEMFLSDRRVRAAAVAIVLNGSLSAQTPAEWMALGNDAYKQKLWPQAADDYRSATQVRPARPETDFNLGLALYRMKEYTSAAEAFSRAKKAARGTPLEAASKLGEADCAYRLAIVESPPLYQQKLRRVLARYEELSAPDAQFNAEVVRRRLADLQHQSQAAPPTPSAHQKAFGPREIVRQGAVPGGPRSQIVDKDW